ncbi:hypothetical protein [Acidovorax sp. NB1]|uniref:hypothetical protein n=1 Tax=Acidovorax sp. NB1 TaxID=1943571 RepID=UPI0010F21ADB|nr:hypothetical protein [Acidovorax sp. NB1]GDY37742.1 hypothetical protein ACINB_36340 [Acidovorax sp. NB1]
MAENTNTERDYPELPQGWPARFRCDSCDGNGEVGDPISMGYFQPPERERCPNCEGKGWCSEEDAFSAEHMRAYVDADRKARASLSLPAAGQEPAPPPMDGEIALIEKALERAGISSLLNHGAASCVFTEGCCGVSQDQILAYTREIALHCAVALGAAPQPAVAAGWIASAEQMPPPGERVFWMDKDSRMVGYDTWMGEDFLWAASHWMRIPPCSIY